MVYTVYTWVFCLYINKQLSLWLYSEFIFVICVSRKQDLMKILLVVCHSFHLIQH